MMRSLNLLIDILPLDSMFQGVVQCVRSKHTLKNKKWQVNKEDRNFEQFLLKMENNELNWQLYLLLKLKQEWSDKLQLPVFLGKIPSKPKMPNSVSPFLTFILGVTSALGPLPDASQEGILWSWKGYGSVALFHYNVIAILFFKICFFRLFQQYILWF